MLNCMAMRPQQPLNRACVCSLSVCYSVALSVLHAHALGGEGAGLMFYHNVLDIKDYIDTQAWLYSIPIHQEYRDISIRIAHHYIPPVYNNPLNAKATI